MQSSPRTISLGFSEEKVPEGAHLCLVFSNEEERIDCLLKYLLSGLVEGESCAAFSNSLTEESVRAFLAEHGIDYDERKSLGSISLSGTNEVYFEDGCFDPERMLNNITNFYQQAITQDYAGARVIGEMVPEVESVPGGDRLLEYECRISLLVRHTPVTAICQYDARAFDGATIMEILKVHPQIIVNGSIVSNPLFIEPEDYLQQHSNCG